MKRNIFLLVRHGTHDEVGRVLSGRSAIAINDEGRGQAAALARSLAPASLGAIHSSPRRRCVETARPLADATGLEIAIAPALDEVDFGAFTGRSFEGLDGDAEWAHWNAERAIARCPGGETMAEAVARAEAFLLALPAAPAPIVCVTHCDIIRGLAARALGLALGQLLSLPCDPGSVTVMAVEGGTVALRTLNQRPGQFVDQ